MANDDIIPTPDSNPFKRMGELATNAVDRGHMDDKLAEIFTPTPKPKPDNLGATPPEKAAAHSKAKDTGAALEIYDNNGNRLSSSMIADVESLTATRLLVEDIRDTFGSAGVPRAKPDSISKGGRE